MDVWAVEDDASPRARSVTNAFRDAHGTHGDELGAEDEMAYAAAAFTETLRELTEAATAGEGAAGAGGGSAPKAASFATRAACVEALSEALPAVSAGTAATDALVDALVSARAVRLEDEADSDDDDADATTATGEELVDGVAIGAACLALLEEDGEWHEAIVKERLAPTLEEAEAARDGESATAYRVVFTRWAKPQRVTRSQLVLMDDATEDDDEDGGDGLCGMCGRDAPLTRHHLIPRVTHTKYKAKGYSNELLNTCALICRPCHNAVHKFAPNKVLAVKYNTLELLMAQPALAKWAKFAATQPIYTRGTGMRNRR